MLVVALVLVAIGGTLMYASVTGGTLWKQPWQPFVTLLHG